MGGWLDLNPDLYMDLDTDPGHKNVLNNDIVCIGTNVLVEVSPSDSSYFVAKSIPSKCFKKYQLKLLII